MSTKRPARSSAEWITFGIAAAILLGLMGTIAWLGAQPREPAVLKVQLAGEVREADNVRYVKADVTNSGGEPVEAVQVLAEAMVNGEKVDAEQSIQFLAGGATEHVVFIFDIEVPVDEITMRIASYKRPD